jgi:hypothetical protein
MGKQKALSYADHLDLGARVKAAREIVLDIIPVPTISCQ